MTTGAVLRRRIDITLYVRERREISLGQTPVTFSNAITALIPALTDEQVHIERSDVRGVELP